MNSKELLETVKKRAKRAVKEAKAPHGERITLCPNYPKCKFPACLC